MDYFERSGKAIVELSKLTSLARRAKINYTKAKLNSEPQDIIDSYNIRMRELNAQILGFKQAYDIFSEREFGYRVRILDKTRPIGIVV